LASVEKGGGAGEHAGGTGGGFCLVVAQAHQVVASSGHDGVQGFFLAIEGIGGDPQFR
jgi:hypothetical protein